MNLGFYMEKLHSSSEFKTFLKKNPSAYMCSGFFVIDSSGKDNKVHLDYLHPNSGEISSFQVENGIRIVKLQKVEDKMFEGINDDIEIDFDKIQELIGKRMEKEDIKSKVQKVMLSLQKNQGKTHLLGTVFISTLGIISMKISLPDNKITHFEKKSFFDIVNVFKK